MGKFDKLQEDFYSTAPLIHKLDEGENRKLRAERVGVDFHVFASTLKGDLIQGYLQACNLSWSGMLVETNVPFQMGDKVKLEFTLPDSLDPMEANATVIRIDEIDEDFSSVGFCFTQMPTNLRRMLNAFVLEHLLD